MSSLPLELFVEFCKLGATLELRSIVCSSTVYSEEPQERTPKINMENNKYLDILIRFNFITIKFYLTIGTFYNSIIAIILYYYLILSIK